MSDLPEVLDVRVVHVEVGDVVWLRTGLHLTHDQATSIRERAQRIWPDNEVIVAADIDVAIVRKS